MSKKLKEQYKRYIKSSLVTEKPFEFNEAKLVINFNKIGEPELKLVDEKKREVKLNYLETVQYYIGEKGKERFLCTSPNREGKPVLDFDGELLKYDVIIAIDTSYELEIKRAFTAIVQYNKTSDNLFLSSNEIPIIEWELNNIEKPENFMYANAIEHVRKYYLNCNQYPKVAILVDSDFGNISDRTKPIFDNYKLPENFWILYCSSDRGNLIQNKIFRECDNIAKQALAEYKSKCP